MALIQRDKDNLARWSLSSAFNALDNFKDKELMKNKFWRMNIYP